MGGLVALFLALGLVAIQDFLRPGVTHGHDIQHHAWAYWSLWRCVLDGDLWPRWNPYLGLGIPLLSFYSPLAYVLAWPAQALGASPLQAMAYVLFLFQAGGAGAAYASVRWLGGSRAGGLIAAFALALAPYHLLDQNFRLALGETLAFSLFIPVFAASWQLVLGERKRAPWVLGVGMAMMLLIHVLSAVMAILGIGIILTLGLWRRGERPEGPSSSSRPGAFRTLRALVVIGLVTAGSTAAWWGPVVAEQEHTSVGRLSKPGRAISPYAVTVDEVLRRQLWDGYQVRRSLKKLWTLEAATRAAPSPSKEAAVEREKSLRRGMPMYLGWGLFLLLILGIVSPRGALLRAGGDAGDDPPQEETCARSLAIAGGLLILLSIWPAARLLDGLPLFGRIMFPWRLLAPASALAALAGGVAWRHWASPPMAGAVGPKQGTVGVGRSRLLVGVMLALLAVDAAPFLGAAERYPPAPGPGLFVFGKDRAVEAEVPRDRFLRIEDAPLPPSDYRWQLGKSRWVFSEYMAPPLRQRYGKLSKPPSKELSGYFGAEMRFSRNNASQTPLSAQPVTEVREPGGEWEGVPMENWELLPERISIELPARPGPREVRFKGAWFPGWRVRIDGGEWGDTRPGDEFLLSSQLPAGAQRVEFRYFFSSPWHRPASLAVSLLSLLGIAVFYWARRRRVRRFKSG